MMKKNLVVLSGAGISAESGIATFRDSNGLWENHRVEDVASPEAWKKDPDLVTRFYNLRRQSVRAARPNAAHTELAALEEIFNIQIITQNIDDLHERAGSTHVLHLHGEIFKMRCEEDPSDIQYIQGDITDQIRSRKGRKMRPDIVWFGEPVEAMPRAVEITEQADIFVIIGTSMLVYPAAGLIYAAPPHAPIYVIDKQVPYINSSSHITKIEKTATEGIRELKRLLAESQDEHS